MRKPSVIFDFDGTLADATDVLLETYKAFGYPVTEDSREHVSNIGWKKFNLALGVTEEELAAVVKKVCDAAADSGKVAIMEGIHEMLEILKPACEYVGVITSNSERNVRIVLGDDRSEIFDFILSGELSGKGAVLKKIVDEMQLDPALTYYIGDEIRDIEAARHAGVKAIAVSWGTCNVHVLKEAKPDHLIHTLDDLIRITIGN